MPASDAEKQIPKAPPGVLRERYLWLSWNYLYWCGGMFAWCILCIIYFFTTHQPFTGWIGVTLGVMIVAMVVLPALLFGGDTWYKRLAWMVVLLCLFAILFVYPSIASILGVRERLATRYPAAARLLVFHEHIANRPYFSDLDYWQFTISAFTLILHGWTIRITRPAVRLARQLARGEYMPDIDAKKR